MSVQPCCSKRQQQKARVENDTGTKQLWLTVFIGVRKFQYRVQDYHDCEIANMGTANEEIDIGILHRKDGI